MRARHVLLLWGAVLMLASTGVIRADDVALCIGISHYPPALNKSRAADLPTCTNDARAFTLLLQHLGVEEGSIATLLDEQATGQAIVEGIAKHLAKAGPEDYAFLYFSGHGCQVPDDSGDEIADGQDEALVPWDAPTNGVITDDLLGALCRSLETRRLIVILDSCFSGTALLAAKEGPPTDGIPLGEHRPWSAVFTKRLDPDPIYGKAFEGFDLAKGLDPEPIYQKVLENLSRPGTFDLPGGPGHSPEAGDIGLFISAAQSWQEATCSGPLIDVGGERLPTSTLTGILCRSLAGSDQDSWLRHLPPLREEVFAANPSQLPSISGTLLAEGGDTTGIPAGGALGAAIDVPDDDPEVRAEVASALQAVGFSVVDHPDTAIVWAAAAWGRRGLRLGLWGQSGPLDATCETERPDEVRSFFEGAGRYYVYGTRLLGIPAAPANAVRWTDRPDGVFGETETVAAVCGPAAQDATFVLVDSTGTLHVQAGPEFSIAASDLPVGEFLLGAVHVPAGADLAAAIREGGANLAQCRAAVLAGIVR